jgi:hypothetical protein
MTPAITPQPDTDQQEESVPMLSPDYAQAKMVPKSQSDDAISAGWAPAQKMISPEGDRKWVPNEHGDDLKGKGWTPVEGDGSFHVTPSEGESFSDTMKRAAKAGKGVTPDQISFQTKQGLKDAPAALAAGPAMAGGMLTAAGFAPEIAAALKPAAVATAKWAKANPVPTALAYHVARAMGIPLPKVLDLLAKLKD